MYQPDKSRKQQQQQKNGPDSEVEPWLNTNSVAASSPIAVAYNQRVCFHNANFVSCV